MFRFFWSFVVAIAILVNLLGLILTEEECQLCRLCPDEPLICECKAGFRCVFIPRTCKECHFYECELIDIQKPKNTTLTFEQQTILKYKDKLRREQASLLDSSEFLGMYEWDYQYDNSHKSNNWNCEDFNEDHSWLGF